MNAIQSWASLNNGIEMPLLGLGVYGMHGAQAEQSILKALEIGYRLIDTAAMYGNETEVGNAIRTSGIPRSQVFLTSKLNNSDHGYDSTLRAYQQSLQKLQTDYLDLYLIHWPIRGKRKDSWRALEKIYADRQVRAIGVANYLIPFLEELQSHSGITPALNQVEFSPYLYLADLLQYCNEQKIQLQAYSPLVRGKRNNDPRLIEVSRRYSKTVAQIILRWDIQSGVSAIPKSADPGRIRENFEIFDFELAAADMAKINGLNENLRIVDNPMDFL